MWDRNQECWDKPMSFYYLCTVLEIDMYVFVLDVCGSFF